jgi:hypothetical protein
MKKNKKKKKKKKKNDSHILLPEMVRDGISYNTEELLICVIPCIFVKYY